MINNLILFIDKESMGKKQYSGMQCLFQPTIELLNLISNKSEEDHQALINKYPIYNQDRKKLENILKTRTSIKKRFNYYFSSTEPQKNMDEIQIQNSEQLIRDLGLQIAPARMIAIFEKEFIVPDMLSYLHSISQNFSIDPQTKIKIDVTGFKENIGFQLRIYLYILLDEILRLIYSTIYIQEFIKGNKICSQQQLQTAIHRIFLEIPNKIYQNYFFNLQPIHNFLIGQNMQQNIQQNNKLYFKIWVTLQKIKNKYTNNGCMLCKIKFNHCYNYNQQTQGQVLTEWQQIAEIYQKIRNSDRKIDFCHVLQKFQKVFLFNNTQSIHIVSYYKLIIGPLKRIDNHWCKNKIGFLQGLITDRQLSSEQILEQLRCQLRVKIDQFRQSNQAKFKARINNLIRRLSHELLSANLETSYFKAQSDELIKIIGLYRYSVKINTINEGILNDVNLKDLLDQYSKLQINMKIKQQKINANNLDYQQLERYFAQLNIRVKLLQQIKYLRLLSNPITTTNRQDFCRCLDFYRAKRMIFATQQVRGNQLIARILHPIRILNNQLGGFQNSIRVAVFQLITLIKLEQLENIQYHVEQNQRQRESQTRQKFLENLICKLIELRPIGQKTVTRSTLKTVSPVYSNHSKVMKSGLLHLSRVASDNKQLSLSNQKMPLGEVEIKISSQKEIPLTKKSFPLFKLIFQNKIKNLQSKSAQLQKLYQPLKARFQGLKNTFYQYTELGQTNNVNIQSMLNGDFDSNHQQFKKSLRKIPNIEYQLLRKQYMRVWRRFSNIDIRHLKQLNRILQDRWGKQFNLFKFYLNLFIKIREKQNIIEPQQLHRFVDEVLRQQNFKFQNQQDHKQIRQSIKQIQKIQQNIRQRRLRLNILQDEKTQKQKYRPQIVFKGKISPHMRDFSEKQIIKIQTLDSPASASKTYFIKPNRLQRVRQIKQMLINLKREIPNILQISLNKHAEILLKVNQWQFNYQTNQKLVKYIIDTFYFVVNKCRMVLKQNTYFPLLQQHQITFRNDKVKIRYFEGILYMILLQNYGEKIRGLLAKRQHKTTQPFVWLANIIENIFQRQRQGRRLLDRSTDLQKLYFRHLLEEMKALSLQFQKKDLSKVYDQIIKCPYFWSTHQKLYYLADFKQKYLYERYFPDEFIKQNIHKQIKQAYYIENIERQALLQNIHTFKLGNYNGKQTAVLGDYNWEQNIDQQLEQLILRNEEMGKYLKQKSNSQDKEKNRSLNVSPTKSKHQQSVNQKNRNTFACQINVLRNVAIHYIFVLIEPIERNQRRVYGIEEKINIIQRNFPKLFIFLHRWRGLFSKNYEQIRNSNIQLITDLFHHNDQEYIRRGIQRLNNQDQQNFYKYKGSLSQKIIKPENCKDCTAISKINQTYNSLWEFFLFLTKRLVGEILWHDDR